MVTATRTGDLSISITKQRPVSWVGSEIIASNHWSRVNSEDDLPEWPAPIPGTLVVEQNLSVNRSADAQ